MATARIAAGLVLTAATARQATIEAACAMWLEGEIEKVRKEPKVEGPFWRRTITYLTTEQAADEYRRLVAIPRTSQWWGETNKPNAGLGVAKKVQQLARAALSSGDGLVTLDADEVRFLGLEAAA